MTLSSTETREIRKFGVVAFVLFGVLFAIAFWRHKYVPGCFLGGLSFLGLCFLLLPGPFRPIYTRWLKIAHFVGDGDDKRPPYVGLFSCDYPDGLDP